MPRFLSQTDAQYFELMLDLTIEQLDSDDPRYDILTTAYYSFEPASNSAATIAQIVAAIRPVNPQRANELELLVFDRIRTSNYPSGWNQQAVQARNTYVTNHPGSNASAWICPGTGFRPAHAATVADVTIDHVLPVADHWNQIGRNTTNHSRATWYQNTNNHAYLCRACNSSRGSGGIRYMIAVGPAYSN